MSADNLYDDLDLDLEDLIPPSMNEDNDVAPDASGLFSPEKDSDEVDLDDPDDAPVNVPLTEEELDSDFEHTGLTKSEASENDTTSETLKEIENLTSIVEPEIEKTPEVVKTPDPAPPTPRKQRAKSVEIKGVQPTVSSEETSSPEKESPVKAYSIEVPSTEVSSTEVSSTEVSPTTFGAFFTPLEDSRLVQNLLDGTRLTPNEKGALNRMIGREQGIRESVATLGLSLGAAMAAAATEGRD